MPKLNDNILKQISPERAETLVWIERHGGKFVEKNVPNKSWDFEFDTGGGSSMIISFHHRLLSIPYALQKLVMCLNWPGHKQLLWQMHNAFKDQ